MEEKLNDEDLPDSKLCARCYRRLGEDISKDIFMAALNVDAKFGADLARVPRSFTIPLSLYRALDQYKLLYKRGSRHQLVTQLLEQVLPILMDNIKERRHFIINGLELHL